VNLCKAGAIGGVLCLMVWGCGHARQPSAGHSLSAQWGMAVNGLRMSIEPVAGLEPNAVSCAFNLYFQNVGTEDTVLDLGTSLEKGRVHYPHAVRLAIFDMNGNARRLNYSFRTDGAWKDNMEVFAVPLPAGSVYAVRVHLSDYYCGATGEYYIDLPDGEYRVFADYEVREPSSGGSDANDAASANFWAGRAQSNVARFRVTRRAS
jgi:hypothetical protein